MTVTELRKALEVLEAQGKGDLPVGFVQVICHDSDRELEFEEIAVAEEKQPAKGTWVGYDRQRIVLS